MSKLLVYLLAFIAIIFIGLFAFFAIGTPYIEQNPTVIDVEIKHI